MRETTTDQFHAAATTLRRRADSIDLSPAARDYLCRVFADAADSRAPHPLHAEAAALAHRIVDDDHPEDSDLWRAAAGR